MSGTLNIIAAILSFVISAILGKIIIPFLHKINFGQVILDIGPNWHKNKQGTPVMGGIMFIIGIVISVSVCLGVYYNSIKSQFPISSETTLMQVRVISGLIMALCYGLIGFFDDYIKVVKKRNMGLSVMQKLVLQFVVAICYFFVLYLAGGNSSTIIPFVGEVDLGIFYYVLGVLLITGFVNAINFTDGVDGLNSSVTFFVCIFFMLISNILYYNGISILSAASAGGLLGFLIWNFHPAKVFMGDMGSLFLGGLVCALAFGINMPILLFILGIIYIIEILSVVMQVIYFKATKGKRLFKMSPIHHHFELSGWKETKICVIFSMVTVLSGIIAFLLVLYGV